MSGNMFPKLAGSIAASLILLAGCATAVPSGDAPTTPSGASLGGTAWVLDSMGGEPAAEGSTMTVQFTKDGMMSGSGGCNRFNGKFTTTGEEIVVEPLASTMMACEQSVMTQETSFLNALQGAKGFTVSGDKLTISDGAGAETLVFAVQSQDLPGSAWVVTGYNNGAGAVTSTVVDTVAEVSFEKDGTVNGTGGCNRFTGTFNAEKGTITIEKLAQSAMACPEPAGLMEQEAALVAALQSATGYTVEGNDLRLTTADGETAATLTRS